MRLAGEPLRDLDRDACFALLATGGLGRVGLTHRALPVVLPVHFAWLDDRIVFAVGAGSVLELATRDTIVGFEVDGTDDDDHLWSVSVTGHAAHLGPAHLWTGGRIRLGRWSVALDDRLVAIWPDVITGQVHGTAQERRPNDERTLGVADDDEGARGDMGDATPRSNMGRGDGRRSAPPASGPTGRRAGT